VVDHYLMMSHGSCARKMTASVSTQMMTRLELRMPMLGRTTPTTTTSEEIYDMEKLYIKEEIYDMEKFYINKEIYVMEKFHIHKEIYDEEKFYIPMEIYDNHKFYLMEIYDKDKFYMEVYDLETFNNHKAIHDILHKIQIHRRLR